MNRLLPACNILCCRRTW